MKKFNAKNDAKEAEQGRAALAGMSSLQDLTGMSLDREECREIGDWKEYTKSNGKKWYYHKPTGTMQWAMPDEQGVVASERRRICVHTFLKNHCQVKETPTAPHRAPAFGGGAKWCSTSRNGLKIAIGTKEGTMCAPCQHEAMPT